MKKNNPALKKVMRKGAITFSVFLVLAIAFTVGCFKTIGSAVDGIPFFLTKRDDVGQIEIADKNYLPQERYYIPAEFPMIYLYEQYATLTIKDAELYDAPVTYGDYSDILRSSIGQYAASRFPGQNGKIVLCAHVSRQGRHLEDLKPGAIVTVNTKYGDYEYRLTRSVIFDEKDSDIILPNDGTEELVMYTCYPYDNGGAYRTQRIAIVCEKIHGKNWITGEVQ